jgi:hypothetical protein
MLHGTLNPPPIPTVIPAPTGLAAAAVGDGADGSVGLLSLPDDVLNAVVNLIIAPAAAAGSDTLSVACLGASCRRLYHLCQQHLPPLLSYLWEPMTPPPPAPPLPPPQAEVLAGSSPSRLARLAAQFPELELWQQQESTAVMIEHSPSPELLHKLRRLASTSLDDDDDDGATVALEPPPPTGANADDHPAMFPHGVPAGFRPVRRWRPSHELISVGRIGAVSGLQWQMTGEFMAEHLQSCRFKHEGAGSDSGSVSARGLSLLGAMVHAQRDEVQAWHCQEHRSTVPA